MSKYLYVNKLRHLHVKNLKCFRINRIVAYIEKLQIKKIPYLLMKLNFILDLIEPFNFNFYGYFLRLNNIHTFVVVISIKRM